MSLIELAFVADRVEITPPDASTIRPKINYRIDGGPATIELHFSIDQADVNLEIEKPDLTQVIDNLQGDFRKQVVFKVITSGKKKNFTLKLTGIIGSNSLTDTLAIIYK